MAGAVAGSNWWAFGSNRTAVLVFCWLILKSSDAYFFYFVFFIRESRHTFMNYILISERDEGTAKTSSIKLTLSTSV